MDRPAAATAVWPPDNRTSISKSALSTSGNDFFSSVSASSMDQKPLAGSKRILLFHLTNVFNTGKFLIQSVAVTRLDRK